MKRIGWIRIGKVKWGKARLVFVPSVVTPNYKLVYKPSWMIVTFLLRPTVLLTQSKKLCFVYPTTKIQNNFQIVKLFSGFRCEYHVYTM